jgi:hypothetical protein
MKDSRGWGCSTRLYEMLDLYFLRFEGFKSGPLLAGRHP